MFCFCFLKIIGIDVRALCPRRYSVSHVKGSFFRFKCTGSVPAGLVSSQAAVLRGVAVRRDSVDGAAAKSAPRAEPPRACTKVEPISCVLFPAPLHHACSTPREWFASVEMPVHSPQLFLTLKYLPCWNHHWPRQAPARAGRIAMRCG